MSIYEKLNREQQKACFQTKGPVLILAGAGSGKTRVITHRIAYLIEERGVDPWNILAITFTNKAAGEMRDRVEDILGGSSQGVWISTFHSMCVRILRRYIDLLGYDPKFVIYDTSDQKTLMKEACRQLRIDTKTLKEREILSAVSAAKNELMTPLQYHEENDWESFRKKQIGMAYEEYQRLLRKNNALDFDDLLMLTVELFKSHDEVLATYQQRFTYIMVDEYQDTNTAQFELVRLLAGSRKNLCVVGDDDQSIYRFRGADIRNILDFEKIYPEALVVRLEQNYRSRQNILEAANAVIKNNTNRRDKHLWSDRGEGDPVHVRQFYDAQEEAAFVVQDIRRKLAADSSLSYKSFAILYRTNAQSRALEERLVLSSVPYNVIGGTNFYDRREIKDVLCYLKIIDNGRDDIALGRIINVPRRGIGQTTLTRAADYAALEQVSLFEVMEKGDQIPGIKSAGKKLRAFADMIKELRAYAEDHTLVELARQTLEVTGYLDALKDSDEDDAEDRADNVGELVSKIADYEKRMQEAEEEADLSGFLEDVALVADIDSMEESDDRVLLMTLHSAKGLEFPHVYITGLEENIFPSYQSLQDYDPESIAEERRLAYVGITRAMDDLTLTCARSRMVRGEFRYNPMSRFLAEIPENITEDGSRSRRVRTGLNAGDRSLSKSDIFESDRNFSGKADGISTGTGFTGKAGGAGLTGKAGSQGSGLRTVYGQETGPGLRAGSGSGSGSGSGLGTGSAGTAGSGKTGSLKQPLLRSRPKAIYVKPHTQEEKKPFIAKVSGAGSGSLSSLTKGMPAPKAPDYSTGDRVRHIKFGEGVVMEIEKSPRDYKVTVQFDECGQKIMYAGFAKLQKL